MQQQMQVEILLSSYQCNAGCVFSVENRSFFVVDCLFRKDACIVNIAERIPSFTEALRQKERRQSVSRKWFLETSAWVEAQAHREGHVHIFLKELAKMRCTYLVRYYV